jgi:hypothetical protein
MINLNPTWDTPAGNLGAFSEGTDVSYQLATTLVGKIVGVPRGTQNVYIGFDTALIDTVYVNGFIVSYTRAGQSIIIQPLSDVSTVSFSHPSTGLVQYSLIGGNLPPGLSMTSDGLIFGQIGAVAPLGAHDYEFVVRAQSATGIGDHTFSITGMSFDYDISFNLDALPELTTNNFQGFDFFDLGGFSYGEPVSYTIDVTSHAGAPVFLAIDPLFTVMDSSEDYNFAALPYGIDLVDGQIQGTIDGQTPMGSYFFKIDLIGSQNSESIIMGLQVLSSQPVSFTAPSIIHWNTPAGLIGSIGDGEPCFLSVSAYNSSSAAVAYSMSPNAQPWPAGLTINSVTGNLVGIIKNPPVPYVDISVRARTGHVFSDRAFRIAISPFNHVSVYDISLILDETSALQFNSIYQDAIKYSTLFRQHDPSYGIIKTPYVYLLKGVPASANIANLITTYASPSNNTYFKPIKMLLGEHHSAKALDDNGTEIYDVIYRHLYDFQEGAGGFSEGSVVVPQPIIYSHSVGIEYVLPISIRNFRCGLVDMANFSVPDSLKARTIGPNGPEEMPRWMTSIQDNGAVPGFVAALPIAFVLPGTGAGVAAALNGSVIPPKNGLVYGFNRLYLGPGFVQL